MKISLNKWFKNIASERSETVSRALITNSSTVWDSWDVYRLVNKGYLASPWVYSAVSLIAKNIGTVPFKIYDSEGNLNNSHYLSKVLNSPNPFMSRQNFFELLVIFLQLSGKAPILKTIVGDKTKELSLISPDRIQAIRSTNSGKLISGYEIITDKGSIATHKDFNLDTVIYLRFPDPSNPVEGISPLEVAIRAVQIDSELQNYGKSTAENLGVVSGIITFKQQLTPSQAEAASEALKEVLGNNKRAGVPAVLHGEDIEYIRLALNTNEMQYLDLRKFSREEILSVFGVPPQVLGYDGVMKYDNFISGQKILWENTLIPVLSDIRDSLNIGLSNELEDNYIDYDISEISILKHTLEDDLKNNKLKAETAKIYYDMGFGLDEINTIVGLGLQDNLEDGDSNEIDDSRTSSCCSSRSISQEDLDNEFKAPSFKRLYKGFEEILNNQRKEVQNVLNDLGLGTDLKLILQESINTYSSDIEKVLREEFSSIVRYYLNQPVKVEGLNENSISKFKYRSDTDIEALMKEVLDEVDYILAETALIQSATLVLVYSEVQNGILLGSSINEIAQKLTDSGAFDPERALRIARTETATAQSLANLTNAKELGATHKTWNAGAGARQLHSARSGVTVPINGTFSLGVRFPSDPFAKAADRINCRCALTYSIDEKTQTLIDIEDGGK